MAFSSDQVSRRFDKAQNLRRQYLKLPDQKEVIISYHPDHGENGTYKVRIFMRKEGSVIWDKTFSENMDEYWIGAAFIPVVKGAYFYDVNDNGNLEIAVVVTHGGNAVWNTPAMIFSVKNTGLEFLKKQQVNDEFSEYVYSSKSDFENPAYKCSSCIEREYYYADGKKAPLSSQKHDTSTKQ